MKYFSKKSLIYRHSIVVSFGLFCASFAFFALPALASSVTLSVVPGNNVANGNYNSVVLTVSGPSNSAVQLYYYPTNQYPYTTYSYGSTNPYNTGSPTFAGTLGTTESDGYFSVTLSNTSYNIPVGAEVYVLVGGQQSNIISWPNPSSYVPYPPTYPYPVPVAPVTPAETGSVSVGVDQSLSIYAQSGGSYTITSNSNPEIVSASASGSTITIRGNEVGSAAITICPIYYTYNTSPCASVIVTVTPSLSFSQSNVTLYGIGSSQTVTLSGGYGYNSGYTNVYGGVPTCGTYQYQYGCGAYYIAGNSNPGTVSATISGNYLYVSGIGYGGSTITVCQSSGSPCGTVYVSVNGATNYYSSGYPYYYQQPNQYVYTQPLYIQPPAPIYNNYSQPTYLMRGWMRRY